ncbi:MAG: hypothetical protein ACLP8Y_02775 [Thermoplasmata archaeon]
MDLTTLLEILVPLAVALFAVWLSFRYQLYALDRETRKSAYLDALDCLQGMADLLENQEQISYAGWLLATKLKVPETELESPENLRTIADSLIHWTVRSLEIGSRFGLQVDWTIVGHFDKTDWGKEFLGMKSLLTGSVLHQQELYRVRFNRAMITASSVTRLGVFWVFVRKRSENERWTQGVLKAAHNKLDEIIRSFPIDPLVPNPVDWNLVNSVLRDAQTAAFTNLGTLGHMGSGVLSQREKIPWPDFVLKSTATRATENRTAS